MGPTQQIRCRSYYERSIKYECAIVNTDILYVFNYLRLQRRTSNRQFLGYLGVLGGPSRLREPQLNAGNGEHPELRQRALPGNQSGSRGRSMNKSPKPHLDEASSGRED